MSSPQPFLDKVDHVKKLYRQIRWLWICGVVLATLVLTIAGLAGYFVRQKSKEIEDLEFSQFIDDDLRSTDYVTPTG